MADKKSMYPSVESFKEEWTKEIEKAHVVQGFMPTVTSWKRGLKEEDFAVGMDYGHSPAMGVIRKTIGPSGKSIFRYEHIDMGQKEREERLVQELTEYQRATEMMKVSIPDFGTFAGKYRTYFDGIYDRKNPPAKVPVTKATIEEIHAAFYNAIDPLLKAARVMLPVPKETEEMKRANRLRALGFTGAKEVKAANIIGTKRDLAIEENKKKQSFVTMVEYFAQKYPLYKFITEDSVKQLCDKYGLVYGPIDRYIGTIPEKNLIEMENFRMDEEDALWGERNAWNNAQNFGNKSKGESMKWNRVQTEMVAPIQDFNTEGMKVKDFEIMPQDPIVLEPVWHWSVPNGKAGYLIKTAWGPEASDPLVKNEKMN